MGAVIPSILVATKAQIERALHQLSGHAETVQIDVVDGILAGPPTWPYANDDGALPPEWDIHEMGDFRYEMDLMVREPEEAMGTFLHAGAGKIILHVESARDVGALIDVLERDYGRDKEFSPELLSLALSANVETDLALLEPHLPRIDYVQFMGIARIGSQGQPFDERVIAKIREFKKRHPEVPVQVDGGVSLATAPRLLAAGAERLVVGSAIWKAPNPLAALAAFEELVLTYARYR